MTNLQIYNKLNHLKPSFKMEVNHFIEFLLQKQKNQEKNKKPQFGCAKGKFRMSADFDEPLEDFKEYME